MNTTMKATLALGAAGLSLLSLTGGARAQSTTPAANYTVDFSTVAPGQVVTFGTGPSTLGVGFDTSNPKVPSTQGTAQSLYEAFVFDSSAAGAFTTINSGQQVQVQLFASNQNPKTDATGAPIAPFNIYAELFAYDPNAAASNVPVTGPNLFGSPVQVALDGSLGGGFFSGVFNTTGSIVAGQKYVLGITTLNGQTQDFATVSTSPFSKSGTPTADQTFDKAKFETQYNDNGTPGAISTTSLTTNVLGFSIGTIAPTAAPEPSQFVTFGVAGLGMALAAFKRRRNNA